jgi:hypothetical protein
VGILKIAGETPALQKPELVCSRKGFCSGITCLLFLVPDFLRSLDIVGNGSRGPKIIAPIYRVDSSVGTVGRGAAGFRNDYGTPLFSLFILVALDLHDNGNGSVNRRVPVNRQSVERVVGYYAVGPAMNYVLHIQPALIRFHFDEHFCGLAETGQNGEKHEGGKSESDANRTLTNSQRAPPGNTEPNIPAGKLPLSNSSVKVEAGDAAETLMVAESAEGTPVAQASACGVWCLQGLTSTG